MGLVRIKAMMAKPELMGSGCTHHDEELRRHARLKSRDAGRPTNEQLTGLARLNHGHEIRNVGGYSQ